MRISDWSSDVCSSDLKLVLAVERLVAHRVPAGIAAEIDLALVLPGLPQRLAGAGVPLLGGADEIVVAVVHDIGKIAEVLRHPVCEGLRIDAGGLGRLLHFLPVLAGAGTELPVITAPPP